MVNNYEAGLELLRDKTLAICRKCEELCRGLSREEKEAVIIKFVRESIKKAVINIASEGISNEEIDTFDSKVHELEEFALNVCRKYFNS